MKVLIIGTGLIGESLVTQLEGRGHQVTVAGRRKIAERYIEFDLAVHSPNRLLAALPEVVVFSAAMTGFKQVESNLALSESINVLSTIKTLDVLQQVAHVVFLSTSAIFDGTIAYPSEFVTPRPVTAYANQKLRVEKFLQEKDDSNFSIVRLTKVLNSNAPILKSWQAQLTAGQTIAPFEDIIVSPVSLSYTLTSLAEISEKKLSGIFHLSNMQDFSYADIARLYCKHNLIDERRIKPIESFDSNVEVAHRPRFASLGMGITTTKAGIYPYKVVSLEELFGLPQLRGNQ